VDEEAEVRDGMILKPIKKFNEGKLEVFEKRLEKMKEKN